MEGGHSERITRLESHFEYIRRDLDRLADGQAAIHTRLDEKFSETAARFDAVGDRFDAFAARIDARFDAAAARIDAGSSILHARLDANNSRLDANNARLDSINEKMEVVLRKLETLPTKADLWEWRVHWTAICVAAIAIIVGGIVGGLSALLP